MYVSALAVDIFEYMFHVCLLSTFRLERGETSVGRLSTAYFTIKRINYCRFHSFIRNSTHLQLCGYM